MIMSRICTVYYFAHFLVIMPLLGFLEKPKALPASISDAVLGKSGSGQPAGAVSAPEDKG